MIIDSYDNEKKKDLPVGAYSLYALGRIDEWMGGETATVTLAQWEAKGKSGSKLPMRKPVVKFKVNNYDLSWQLELLEQALEFANEKKCDRVFRFISLGASISSQKDWATLKNNCRLIREEKERGQING